VAQSHLRGILGYLGVTVMGAPETCVRWNDNVLSQRVTHDYLVGFLDAFAAHVTAGTA